MDKRGEAYGQVSQEKDGHTATGSGGGGRLLGGRLGQNVWTQASLPLAPGLLPDDTPVAAAKNMPGDSADLFGDGAVEDGGATNGRLWRTVIIGEQEHRIDLHMIRPYMRVVTHGGETAPPGLLPAPASQLEVVRGPL